MTHALPLSLSLVLASVAVPAHAAEPTVVVDVDVSALPADDMTDWLKTGLIEQQVRILRDGGLEVVDSGGDATIRVTVSRYGDLGIHYRVTVALFQGNGATPKLERTLTCEACRDDELITKVGEEVARLSGRLLVEPEGQPEESPAAPEPEGPAGDPDPEQTEGPVTVRRIGGAGWAGIAVAAAGIGVTIGGAVELSKPPTSELTPGDFTSETFTRPRRLGSSLVGVGVGLVVAGAVLIAVDQTALLAGRRRRARLSLVPVLSPMGVGLSAGGRF